nr:hypothetical protein [Escherichia coli]
MTFSPSYEPDGLRNDIRECNLDSGARFISASQPAGAVLIFWHELAINGYVNECQRDRRLIDADFQRLRNLIWPEDDR